jgi:regulatory protein
MPDLRQDNDYSEQELQQLTAINPADIRVAAMDLLSRREHSRRELKQKLKKRFEDEDLIEAQLDRLAEENLQSDARFAESFLRQRCSRGHGPIRIRQEMRHKGIPGEGIEAAMAAEDCDWYALAEQVMLRKFGGEPAQDIKEKARRSRFMQYRGFSADHFRHLL